MAEDLTKAETEKILREHAVGHLACCDDHWPYVVPVAYFYENGMIYGFSNEGQKISLLRKNPHACFQVEEIEHATVWRSVMVWGMYEEISDNNERMEILARLYEHTQHVRAAGNPVFVPFDSSATMIKAAEHGRIPVVYRITVTEQSGRCDQCS